MPLIFPLLFTLLTAASPKAQILDIRAGDYFFQAPATARPGLTTIRIKSVLGNHLFQLYRIDGNHSAAELVAELKAEKPVSWAKNLGGTGVAFPGKTAEASYILEPGKYAILCPVHAPDLQRHFMKGMYAELTVSGARIAGELPKPDIDVTATDYKWTFSKPLTAGAHVVRFTNAGTTVHMFKLVRGGPGSTLVDVMKWKEGDKPLKGDFITLSPMGPGGSVISRIVVPAGDYTLWCIPQVKKGMVQQLKVR